MMCADGDEANATQPILNNRVLRAIQQQVTLSVNEGCKGILEKIYSVADDFAQHKTVPYEQILSTVELSNLKKRRIYQSMVLVYKSLYGDGPEYIKNLFSFRKTHYSLRGDGYKLAIPRFNLLWKKKSFSYMAANVWNSLPSKVHNTASLTEFKSNLKKAIL